MQSAIIQSATSTPLSYTAPSSSDRTSSNTSLPDDQVDLRSSSKKFADMDPEQNSWDISCLDSTLAMVRGSQAEGVHGNLDPGRAAGLLRDAGFGMA